MPEGVKEKDDAYEIAAWVAGDDEDNEGVFLNWYTNQPILYLPWTLNRPYKGGTKYNYLRTSVKAALNDTNIVVRKADIEDETATNWESQFVQ